MIIEPQKDIDIEICLITYMNFFFFLPNRTGSTVCLSACLIEDIFFSFPLDIILIITKTQRQTPHSLICIMCCSYKAECLPEGRHRRWTG